MNLNYLVIVMLLLVSMFVKATDRSDYANIERQKIAQLQMQDFRNPYLNSNVHNYSIQMRNEYEEEKALKEVRQKYRMQNSYNERSSYSQRNSYSQYNNNYNQYEQMNNREYYNDVRKDRVGKVVNVEESEQCSTIDRTSGGEQLTGALIGGAIGNQFGSGNGRKIMTATGAIVGAGIASNEDEECSIVYTMTIERKIKINGQRDIEYLQFNSDMPIGIGTKIKLSEY